MCIAVTSDALSSNRKAVIVGSLVKPLVFTLRPDDTALGSEGELTKAGSAFLERFKKDPARVTAGRGQRNAPIGVVDVMEDLVKNIFEGDVLLPKIVPEGININDTIFGVIKDKQTFNAETGFLPSIRIGLGGSRVVVTTRFQPLFQYLQHIGTIAIGASGNPEAVKKHMSALYSWRKTAAQEDWKRFKAATTQEVYHCTVCPNDILYIPTGFAWGEKISGADFVGVRSMLLLRSEYKNLESFQRFLMSIDSPKNAILDFAVDALSLAD